MHKAGHGVSRTIDRADIPKADICLYIWLPLCMLRLRRTVLPILRLTTAAVEQTPCTMANVFALSSASRMFSSSTGISTTGLRVSQALRLIAMPPLARVPTALQNGRSSSRFSTALRATSNNRNLSALAAAVSCSGTSPTMLDKTCARCNSIDRQDYDAHHYVSGPTYLPRLVDLGVHKSCGHGGKTVGGRLNLGLIDEKECTESPMRCAMRTASALPACACRVLLSTFQLQGGHGKQIYTSDICVERAVLRAIYHRQRQR